LSINCSTAAASRGGKASSSRPQQGRTDQKHHGNDPERLPIGAQVHVGDRGQRRIGGPARFGRAARNKEAGQHQNAANEIQLVADHVQARERHVRRADLQRHDEVAEGAEGQRHNGQEHHDGAVHGAEGVIKIGRNHPGLADHAFPQQMVKNRADNRHAMPGIGQLPAHDRHQAQPQEQKHQAGDAILDSNDLVIGGKDVFPPEAWFLMARGQRL
jgi:hypothetical protein